MVGVASYSGFSYIYCRCTLGFGFVLGVVIRMPLF